MIWLGLLKRFWPYLAFALAAILILGGIYRTGYKAGAADTNAHWQPLFDAADKARAAADAKTESLAKASTALTQRAEVEHAEVVASLNLRAADAERRISALSVRIAASACRIPLSSDAGTTGSVDVSAEVSERAERAGASLTDVARRCESDALQLQSLQRWIRDQRAILSQ